MSFGELLPWVVTGTIEGRGRVVHISSQEGDLATIGLTLIFQNKLPTSRS